MMTAMTRTGPNDARHVVWAIGELYIYILCVFYILSKYFRCILQSMGWGEWEQQERAQTMPDKLFGP